MNGIINLNKPAGWTSHDSVQAIRRLFGGVKAGHAGTLDPSATGVLPVCLGKATRIVEYLVDLRKSYLAGVTLGVTTTTGDADGEVVEYKPLPLINRGQIEEIFSALSGEQEQLPPLFSAVKYRGKPLYYWTRKGQQVERSARRIFIYRLELLELNQDQPPHLVFEVECSKGTYIRSLAAEIGERLACGAHLSSLVRLAVGPLLLKGSLTYEQLQLAATHQCASQFLLPMDSVLQHLPAVTVDDQDLQWLKQGKTLILNKASAIYSAELKVVRVYDSVGQLRALARCQNNGQTFAYNTEKFLLP